MRECAGTLEPRSDEASLVRRFIRIRHRLRAAGRELWKPASDLRVDLEVRLFAGVAHGRIDIVAHLLERRAFPQAVHVGFVAARIELPDPDCGRSTVPGEEVLTAGECRLWVSDRVVDDDEHLDPPLRLSEGR